MSQQPHQVPDSFTYPQPDPPTTIQPRSLRAPKWAIVALAVVIVAVCVAALVVLFLSPNADAPPAPPAPKGIGRVGAAAPTPQSISRADLMESYAKLAPRDQSATPETMDTLAASTCRGLDQGVTTDAMITVATRQFHANATEVIRLLVSYRCPTHLSEFK